MEIEKLSKEKLLKIKDDIKGRRIINWFEWIKKNDKDNFYEDVDTNELVKEKVKVIQNEMVEYNDYIIRARDRIKKVDEFFEKIKKEKEEDVKEVNRMINYSVEIILKEIDKKGGIGKGATKKEIKECEEYQKKTIEVDGEKVKVVEEGILSYMELERFDDELKKYDKMINEFWWTILERVKITIEK